jgi:hypothetical protein
METECYLGDSVYVEFDGYSYILTTRNGLPTDPSNTIILEPETYEALVKFVREIEKTDG